MVAGRTDPVAQHDVVVHDGLDEGVPDGAPPQQRLWQAACEHVPHPTAHVSLQHQGRSSWRCLFLLRCSLGKRGIAGVVGLDVRVH